MRVQLVEVATPVPSSEHERTPGVHISSVIRNIAFDNKILKPEYVEDFALVEVTGHSDVWWGRLSPDVKLKISMGLAWEGWYMPNLKGVDHQPGEMVLNGVYMTPDGESIDFVYAPMEDFGGRKVYDQPTKYELALHECKLTYKSTKTVGDLATQWLWLAQLKGYCKGMGTTVAFLHVLFVCGDYGFPIRPLLKVWRVVFTELELNDNWDTMTTYIKSRQEREEEML